MKKVGIIKRVLCISLVFLLNINALAAVVSDNDGSAFITKAEFDSLKNNFQSQIDQYNQSIDSKIDGAIAQYLAGIQVSSTQQVVLCNGKDMRVVFFTPSVQDNNWKRGRMGIDITETACGLGTRMGSYDYFTNFAFSRDGTLYPFEAIIKDSTSGGYFYTDDYVLNYTNKLCNFYANQNKTLNLYGMQDGQIAWGTTYKGTACTIIDKSTTGSDGGGESMMSHYPLRSDWFKIAGDHCLGEVAAKSVTSNNGTLSDTTSKIYSCWTVEPSLADNFDKCCRDYFIIQGPNTAIKFWNRDLTTITTVADIASGWTDSSDAVRKATLPSDFGITIPYVYACYSLAQSTNMYQKYYGAGSWATVVAITGWVTSGGDKAYAQDYIEPELQMDENGPGYIKWEGAADWGSNIGTSFDGYFYNGYPVVKWDNRWKTLEFDVENSNTYNMIINFRSSASGANAWITAQGGSELVISIDGVDQGKTYGVLTPGTHKITITPKTSFQDLWVKVGWSSTTVKDRGYFHMPLSGMALYE